MLDHVGIQVSYDIRAQPIKFLPKLDRQDDWLQFGRYFENTERLKLIINIHNFNNEI